LDAKRLSVRMNDFWELKLICASAEGNESSEAIATAVVVRHMMRVLSAQAPGREVFGLACWYRCYCIRVLGRGKRKAR